MNYTVRDDIGYDYRTLTILCLVVYATKRFTQFVLYEAKERLEERYRLQTQGYDLEKVTNRVSSELGIEPEQVWTAGKHPITVKARSLMCYWAVRRLGFSATELSKKLGVSQPSVSISVKRGEKIAKAMQLEFSKE